MKKLSMMVALGLTMSMMFGMTAFAAESVSTQTTVVDGEKVEVPEVTADAINGDQTVEAEIKDVEEAAAAEKKEEVYASAAGDTSKITGATTLSVTSKVDANVDSTVVTETEKASLEAVNKETTASTVVVVGGEAKAVVVETKKLADETAAQTIKSATTSIRDMISKTLTEADAYTDADLSVIKIDKVEAIGATDVVLPVAVGNNIPAGGIDVTIDFPGLKVENSKTYFLLHLTEGNEWESLSISGIEDGKVTAKFTSFSPVVLNEVVLVAGDTKDEEEEEDNDNTVAVAVTAANTGAATSPKTGETLPVAGVVALVAAVGAATATRKVRYNK